MDSNARPLRLEKPCLTRGEGIINATRRQQPPVPLCCFKWVSSLVFLWAMVRHRRPYNPNRLGSPELVRAKKERFLRRQAEQLGFVLTPVQGEVS